MSRKVNNKIPGQVEWFINDFCNYKCSYCFVDKRSGSNELLVKDYLLFLKHISTAIPKGWNFLLIGAGEPFIHPFFIKIVQALIDEGYTVSVNTNFSASYEDLRRFFDITKGKCLQFIASLHLEYADVDEFAAKIKRLKKEFPDFSAWQVVSVAIPGKVKALVPVKSKFDEIGVRFEARRYRDKKHGYSTYDDEEKQILNQINNSQNKSSIDRTIKTKGLSCWCGNRQVVINPLGQVFRCVPAMQAGKSMGDITNADFGLFDQAKICEFDKCFCFERYRWH